MSPLAQQMFEDLAAWQAMLDRHGELFADMAPRSCIGLLPKESAAAAPGKRATGLFASVNEEAPPTVLTWEVGQRGMQAAHRACRGLQETGADLLLVADDEALETLREHIQNEPLSVMKRLIRRGNILFYVMRTKHELQDAGYEDFLDSLGLAFLGACR